MKKLILGLFLLCAAGGGGYFAYDHFHDAHADDAVSEQPITDSVEPALEAKPENKTPEKEPRPEQSR